MAFSRIGSSSSIMWYVFVSTEFLKNGFVSKWNSSLKPLGSLILYHLMSLRYLRASSSLSWICKWKDKNYFKQENGLCMKSQQVGTEYWQFSEENYCTKMQDSTSSARISWFFIALSQKAGTPFSSAVKHCDFSQNKNKRVCLSLIQKSIIYIHLFAQQGFRLHSFPLQGFHLHFLWYPQPRSHHWQFRNAVNFRSNKTMRRIMAHSIE